MPYRSLAVTLTLALIAGCGARSESWDEAPPATESTSDAGPLVCEIAIGRVTLRPWPSNPTFCGAPISCRTFAGHGTHLDCPDDDCDVSRIREPPSVHAISMNAGAATEMSRCHAGRSGRRWSRT